MSILGGRTKQAQKDAKQIASSNLKPQSQRLLGIVAEDPFQNPTPYELVGDLAGAYSRRINIQHRLVYQVYEPEHTIKVRYRLSNRSNINRAGFLIWGEIGECANVPLPIRWIPLLVFGNISCAGIRLPDFPGRLSAGSML